MLFGHIAPHAHSRRQVLLALPALVGIAVAACGQTMPETGVMLTTPSSTATSAVGSTTALADLDQHERHPHGALPSVAAGHAAPSTVVDPLSTPALGAQVSHNEPLPPVKIALLWSTGGGQEPLLHPTGLAMRPDGDLHVVDAGHDRIVVLDSAGQVVRAWGSVGDDVGQFRFQAQAVCADRGPGSCESDLGGAIAIADDGAIYVADYANHRMQVCDATGRPAAAWGTPGEGPGQLRSPGGIAIDAAGRIHVSDSVNQRVQTFDRAGRLLSTWGGRDAGTDTFAQPGGLAVDAQGTTFVANLHHARVCRRDPEGRSLAAWTLGADVVLAAVAVSRPSGLALDGVGNVLLAGGGPYLQHFDALGRPLRRWRSDWQDQLTLQQPAGVAIDRHGDVYVADAHAHCVSKCRILAPTER